MIRDLPPESIDTILARYKAGERPVLIADDYGISVSTISVLVKSHGLSVLKWKRTALTAEQEAEIVNAYRTDNVGATTLGRQYGVDKGTIYSILNRHGVSTRTVGNRAPPKVVERQSRISEKDKAIGAYFVARRDAGDAPLDIFTDLAKQYDMLVGSFAYGLRKQGIDTRSKADIERGRDCRAVTPRQLPTVDPRKGAKPKAVNHAAFDVLTDDACYWVGMLMADGCVYDNGRGEKKLRLNLGLKEGDREHVERFKRFVGSEADIGICARHTFGADRATATMNISSKRIIDRLMSLGVVPNKTGRESCHPQLIYNRHFWRGCIDGDGSIYPNGFYLSGPPGLLDALEVFAQFHVPGARMLRYEQPGVWTGQYKTKGVGVPLLRILYQPGDTALPRKMSQALAAIP